MLVLPLVGLFPFPRQVRGGMRWCNAIGDTVTIGDTAQGTKTWGFNFAKEEDARNMLSQIDKAREIMKSTFTAHGEAQRSSH